MECLNEMNGKRFFDCVMAIQIVCELYSRWIWLITSNEPYRAKQIKKIENPHTTNTLQNLKQNHINDLSLIKTIQKLINDMM